MKIISRSSLIGATAVAMVAYVALTIPALAETQINASVQAGVTNSGQANGQHASGDDRDDQGDHEGRGQGIMIGRMMQPGIMGSVTAINGTTITVVGHALFGGAVLSGQKPKMTATTTYMVDASSATIFKNNATSTISVIAINDRIFAQGTISGANVTAKIVRDGIPTPGMMKRPGGIEGGPSGAKPPVQGNGQPVVAGTVSAVNGNTVTITTSSNTTFTIDAATAKVMKGNSASTVSAVSVGDYVVVQGAVNGSSVTASSIIDSKAPVANNEGRGNGFFGSIGHFFKSLFGF